MTEPRSPVDQELKEGNVLRMFFGEGFEATDTDKFDGSKEERRIFMEIFNLSAEKASKHTAVSSTTNFQKDGNSQSKWLASSNCENSVLTGYTSTKNSSGEASQTTCLDAREDSGSRCCLDNSSSSSVSDPCDAHIKRVKVSSAERKNCNVLAQSSSLSVTGGELIDADQSQNRSSKLMQHQQQSPCLVAETCGQGALSSYYVSKAQGEINGSDDIAMVVKCKSQEAKDGNLVSEPTTVTSPVSQESFASGLAVINATPTLAETTGGPIYAKHYVEESNIMKSGTIDATSKRELIRELPQRLSSHAHCLLTDSGWKIEPRVRSDRAKLSSYYIAPGEKPVVTSLSQAWKICGRRLYSKAADIVKEDNGREWTNIDKFWGDLIYTLLYIETNIQPLRVSISLLKRWQLLDPFVAVVCINRKIGVLREGKSVKAVNSATIILNGENNSVLAKVNSGTGSSNNIVPPAVHLDYVGVTEVPTNQESWQYRDDMQNSSQCKRQKWKHSCSSGTKKKGPKGLAVCIGNSLQDTRCWHHSSDKESASPNNAVHGSDFTCIYRAEGSFSAHSKDFAVGEFSGQDSLPSVLEAPLIDNPDASKADSLKKLVCVEGNSVPSIANGEFLVGGGSSKCRSNKKILMEAKQQTRVTSAKWRVYGKHLSTFDFCDELEQPRQGNTADVGEVIDEKLGMQPSATNSSCNGRLIAFNIHHNLTTEKVTIQDPKSEDLSFSSTQASGSGKKIHKKSKKISEIRACKVDDTCDVEYKEALSVQFDEKIDDYLKLPCNREDSHTPICYSNSGCINASTCATGESRSMIKLWKNMVKSETRTFRYVKGKKGTMTMPLEDKAADGSMHANINGDVRCSEWNVCNLNGLNSQLTSQPKSPSLLVKEHRKCTEDSGVGSDDFKITMTGKTMHSEVMCSVGSAPGLEGNQKIVKLKEVKALKKNKWKRPRGFRINDDDLLIAAIIKNKDYVSCNDKKGQKLGVSQPKKLKKLESLKGGCKLLLRTPGKSGLLKDGKGIVLGARTVLCWLIERGVLSLKDVLQYRNSKNKDLVKDGWITRNGILCKCCKETFSVSAFKTHSGSKIQKASSNLFLESGRSYTLCQLQAWSAEYKARKSRMSDMGVEEVDQNDDTCGLCVDGGELMCCDNCPSTYHQTCLGMQDLPEGSWYCHNCICKSCGDVVKTTKADSRSLAVLQCSQCEHKYHDTCIKKRGLSNGQIATNTWFCGGNCKEVYIGLRSHVGTSNHLADGFSWTILRCNHDDQKINSTQKIALMAECNTKLAIALSIMEECFLPMVDPRTGIDMIPHVLYNWGSNFTRLNYRGFHTVVLEKNDEVLAVAPIRVHGVAVAEMPLIATSSEHRRQGMCRRLMNAIEKMLKSFNVKMLVLSAVPGLVETWTLHFGFKPIGDSERRQLNDINLMLFPGTEMLIKNLEESTTEEPELKNNLCSGGSQSSDPDDFNVTDMNTAQINETATTYSRDGALFLALDATDLVEEHDLEQKDASMSFLDTPNPTSKPYENSANISESFCTKTEKLENGGTGKCYSDEHSVQDTSTCMPVASKSTALPSSKSSAMHSNDTKSPVYHAPAEPIVDDAESENVNILAQVKAMHIMEEDNSLHSAPDVIEENSFAHSLELK